MYLNFYFICLGIVYLSEYLSYPSIVGCYGTQMWILNWKLYELGTKDPGFVRRVGIYFFYGGEMTMLCRVEMTPMTWNVQTMETFDQNLCSDTLLMQKPASCGYNCYLYS
jgi:hypothetical protein